MITGVTRFYLNGKRKQTDNNINFSCKRWEFTFTVKQSQLKLSKGNLIFNKYNQPMNNNFKNGLSLVFSFGKYGGFYCKSYSYSKRLCLGWMAITYFPEDIDNLLERLANKNPCEPNKK